MTANERIDNERIDNERIDNERNDNERIDIDHLSLLARLNLTPDERIRFQKQIGDILDYIGKLNELNVEGIEPMATALPMVNVLRDDEPRPSLDHEAAMANAPDREGPFFRVPRIIDTGKSGGDHDASL